MNKPMLASGTFSSWSAIFNWEQHCIKLHNFYEQKYLKDSLAGRERYRSLNITIIIFIH